MTSSRKQAFTALCIASVLAGAAAPVSAVTTQGAATEGVATLELRGEAATIGSAIHLRQVARWPSSDNAFFHELADLTIARFEPGQRELKLDLAAIRTVLEGAGVAGGEISFRGPLKVTVNRLDSDADHARKLSDNPTDLNDFLAKGNAPATQPSAPAANLPANQPANQPSSVISAAEQAISFAGTTQAPVALPTALPTDPAILSNIPANPVRRDAVGTFTLRMALAVELAGRMGVKADDLEINFAPEYERVLNLAEPTYSWKIASLPVSKQGAVTWRVTLTAAANNQTRTVEVKGLSRVWMEQVQAIRPISSGQILRPEDVESRRVLLERVPDESLLRIEHALAMQSTRAIGPGTVLNMRMLKPVLLVQTGQLVTVTVREGSVTMRAVGKAKEAGVYGQSITVVIGEGRGNNLAVTVTGPQEATTGSLNDASLQASTN